MGPIGPQGPAATADAAVVSSMLAGAAVEYGSCAAVALSSQANSWSACPANTVIVGLYRSAAHDLSGLMYAQCCTIALRPQQ